MGLPTGSTRSFKRKRPGGARRRAALTLRSTGYDRAMIDRPLAPCPACHRHVADEPGCPFCGTPLTVRPTICPTLPGRFSRAAVFAGATVVGCSSGSSSNEPAPSPPPPPVTRFDAPPVPPPPLPDAPTRARVVGRKLTFSGRPLKDSEIALVDPDAVTGVGKGSAGSAGSATPGRRVTRTDREGFFAFEDIEPGDYLLESPGAQHAIHLETGTNHVDFVMPKPPEERHPINMPYGAPPARYRIV
jgi:hypothetical protein